MSEKVVTDRRAVLQAVEEFDRPGRSAFLEKYGFGEAKQYFLAQDGRYYDSKAVYGVARGYQQPNLGPLRSNDFTSGEAQVARRLKQLGFAI